MTQLEILLAGICIGMGTALGIHHLGEALRILAAEKLKKLPKVKKICPN